MSIYLKVALETELKAYLKIYEKNIFLQKYGSETLLFAFIRRMRCFGFSRNKLSSQV